MNRRIYRYTKIRVHCIDFETQLKGNVPVLKAMGSRLTPWAPLGLCVLPMAAFWPGSRVSGVSRDIAALWSVWMGWTSGPRFAMCRVLSSGLGSLPRAVGEGPWRRLLCSEQKADRPSPR